MLGDFDQKSKRNATMCLTPAELVDGIRTTTKLTNKILYCVFEGIPIVSTEIIKVWFDHGFFLPTVDSYFVSWCIKGGHSIPRLSVELPLVGYFIAMNEDSSEIMNVLIAAGAIVKSFKPSMITSRSISTILNKKKNYKVVFIGPFPHKKEVAIESKGGDVVTKQWIYDALVGLIVE